MISKENELAPKEQISEPDNPNSESCIIKEVDMPYASEYGYGLNGCQRINYCSCDCNHIKCPVFLG